MSVRIAIKPKYPTRRATDKVLFNEGNFIDTIDEHSTRHILSILDTAHVALVSEDGKYYPLSIRIIMRSSISLLMLVKLLLLKQMKSLVLRS